MNPRERILESVIRAAASDPIRTGAIWTERRIRAGLEGVHWIPYGDPSTWDWEKTFWSLDAAMYGPPAKRMRSQ